MSALLLVLYCALSVQAQVFIKVRREPQDFGNPFLNPFMGLEEMGPPDRFKFREGRPLGPKIPGEHAHDKKTTKPGDGTVKGPKGGESENEGEIHGSMTMQLPMPIFLGGGGDMQMFPLNPFEMIEDMMTGGTPGEPHGPMPFGPFGPMGGQGGGFQSITERHRAGPGKSYVKKKTFRTSANGTSTGYETMDVFENGTRTVHREHPLDVNESKSELHSLKPMGFPGFAQGDPFLDFLDTIFGEESHELKKLPIPSPFQMIGDVLKILGLEEPHDNDEISSPKELLSTVRKHDSEGKVTTQTTPPSAVTRSPEELRKAQLSRIQGQYSLSILKDMLLQIGSVQAAKENAPALKKMASKVDDRLNYVKKQAPAKTVLAMESLEETVDRVLAMHYEDMEPETQAEYIDTLSLLSQLLKAKL